MKKEFTPNDAGDVTDWFILHGDFSLAVRSTTPANPAGAGVVTLERKSIGADDDEIEQVTSITADAGTAATVNGSERMRGVQHRLARFLDVGEDEIVQARLPVQEVAERQRAHARPLTVDP